MVQFPRFQEWAANRILTEKKSDVPDYSIDRWVQSAKQLGNQVDSLVGQAKEKEADTDKEIEKKKKEKPPEQSDPKAKPDDKPDDEEDKKLFDNPAWKKLHQLAQERAKKKEDDHGRSSGSSPG